MSSTPAAAPAIAPESLSARNPALATRRRVLVTGAAGMLGSEIVAALAGARFKSAPPPKGDPDGARGGVGAGRAGMLGSEIVAALAGAGFEVAPRSKDDLDVTDRAAVTRA